MTPDVLCSMYTEVGGVRSPTCCAEHHDPILGEALRAINIQYGVDTHPSTISLEHIMELVPAEKVDLGACILSIA